MELDPSRQKFLPHRYAPLQNGRNSTAVRLCIGGVGLTRILQLAIFYLQYSAFILVHKTPATTTAYPRPRAIEYVTTITYDHIREIEVCVWCVGHVFTVVQISIAT